MDGILDVHICGACREEFNDVTLFLQHKLECVVLEQLKKRQILSVKHTVVDVPPPFYPKSDKFTQETTAETNTTLKQTLINQDQGTSRDGSHHESSSQKDLCLPDEQYKSFCTKTKDVSLGGLNQHPGNSAGRSNHVQTILSSVQQSPGNSTSHSNYGQTCVACVDQSPGNRTSHSNHGQTHVACVDQSPGNNTSHSNHGQTCVACVDQSPGNSTSHSNHGQTCVACVDQSPGNNTSHSNHGQTCVACVDQSPGNSTSHSNQVQTRVTSVDQHPGNSASFSNQGETSMSSVDQYPSNSTSFSNQVQTSMSSVHSYSDSSTSHSNQIQTSVSSVHCYSVSSTGQPSHLETNITIQQQPLSSASPIFQNANNVPVSTGLISAPQGHEYARQTTDTENNKGSTLPLCQIVTMEKERFLIINNGNQGEVCLPIAEDNSDILAMLHNQLKDTVEQGLNPSSTFVQECQDAQSSTALIPTNMKNLSTLLSSPSTHFTQSIIPPDIKEKCNSKQPQHLSSHPAGDLSNEEHIRTVNTESQSMNKDRVQSPNTQCDLNVPTIQMQLDHNATFSLMSPSLVTSSLQSDLYESNVTANCQHQFPVSLTSGNVGHENVSSLENVSVSEQQSCNIQSHLSSSENMTPITVNTDSLAAPRLSDLQFTPNAILSSIENLQKCSDTESTDIGSNHVNKNLPDKSNKERNENETCQLAENVEGELENLEMSDVVNSYAVHFQTLDKAESSNLKESGTSLDSQVDIGVMMSNDDKIQESQVVEQLHLAYLRTQQNKEKNAEQQRSKLKDKSSRKSSDSPGKKSMPKKKFKCTYSNTCTFVTAYMKDLERHVRVHTGERPFRCDYCSKSFSRIDKLRLHVRGHTGEKPFKCEICDYRAVDNASVKKHMAIHNEERPFKCQTCPYSCRTSSQLTVHLRTHTGDAPFSCPYCESKFKIKSDMKRHVRTHTGEKPFKCELCDFRCSAKSNLVSHCKVHHSEENRYSCDICEFTSSSKRCFYEHQKTHQSRDPELVCRLCKYICSSKQSLKVHMYNAHNFKIYKCQKCGFSSKSWTKANYHYDTCSSKTSSSNYKKGKKPYKSRDEDSSVRKYEKNFPCTICSEAFVRLDSFNSHMKLHKERTQSALSTALTVLELQQPVINTRGVPPGGDHSYDGTSHRQFEIVNISPSFGKSGNTSASNNSESRRKKSRISTNGYSDDFIYERHSKRHSRLRTKETKDTQSNGKVRSTDSRSKISHSNANPANANRDHHGSLEYRNLGKNLHSDIGNQSNHGHIGRQEQVDDGTSTVLLNFNQTSGDQIGRDTSILVNTKGAPQVQNSNIHVVQNISIPLVQLDTGQILAMPSVGSVLPPAGNTEQVLTINPLGMTNLMNIPGQNVNQMPAESSVQLLSPSNNTQYISLVSHPLVQPADQVQTNQKTMDTNYNGVQIVIAPAGSDSIQQQNVVSLLPNSQHLLNKNSESVPNNIASMVPVQKEELMPIDNVFTPMLQPSTNSTSNIPSANKLNTLSYVPDSEIESSNSDQILSAAVRKRENFDTSLRTKCVPSQSGKSYEESNSQIDVQSIELDATSYDFNLQDSELVARESVEAGRQVGYKQ